MQLRLDEAKQLADLAQSLAEAGDADALAILLMLHKGLRQGEVGSRVHHRSRNLPAQPGETYSQKAWKSSLSK
jgi:hypothetical protein